MLALTYHQPYAWLVAAGIKDIENRTWKLPEKFKGQRVLVHAASRKVKFDNWYDSQLTNEQILKLPCNELFSVLDYSAIIGSVEIVDCVVNHHSIWAEKSALIMEENKVCQPKCIFNWVLANPILFDKPILNVSGQQRFWDFHFLTSEPDGIHRY